MLLIFNFLKRKNEVCIWYLFRKYSVVKNSNVVDDLNKSCPNQLLTDVEEKLIFDEIGNSQKKCNCMRGKDVKEMAQKLYNKDWFSGF